MILVTGATGHVGGAVVHRLRPLGHQTVAIVRVAGRDGLLQSDRTASAPARSKQSFQHGGSVENTGTTEKKFMVLPRGRI